MKKDIARTKIKINSNHNFSSPQPRSIIPSNIVIAKVKGMNLDIVAMIGGKEEIGIIIPENAREGIATNTASCTD
jgi:hypothetical protein